MLALALVEQGAHRHAGSPPDAPHPRPRSLSIRPPYMTRSSTHVHTCTNRRQVNPRRAKAGRYLNDVYNEKLELEGHKVDNANGIVTSTQ